jgi:aminoglycoside phosphotransferase family enzyme
VSFTAVPDAAVFDAVSKTSACQPTLAAKVEFLSRPSSYPECRGEVTRRETHMSWVFLTNDRAYKLKKPVRFPYLDFSTLALRETACRAELKLNRRLAPDVYLDVVALAASAAGLSIGGAGDVVDWLVVMRRLDEHQMLDRALVGRRVKSWQIDRLVDTLVQFYRRATPVFVSPLRHLVAWRRSLLYNQRVLLAPRLGMPAGLVRRIDRAQRLFLARRRSLLVDRVRARRIVDAHGDLRPEHIFLGDPLCIIDCLEFNAALRAADPFDEVAFLSLECERLGNAWAGRYIRQRIAAALQDGPSEELFAFYRCYRATLRARLAIAHLLEPAPRTPEKWPVLARVYLQMAFAEAVRLERLLRAPPARRAHGHPGGVRWPPQTGGPPAEYRASRTQPPAPAEMSVPYR